MLEVRDLAVAYGKHEALHGVSLDVAEGETVVILGANGAGKSTLLKAIAGLVAARAGATSRSPASRVLGRRRTASSRAASRWCPRAAASSPTSPSARTCCSAPTPCAPAPAEKANLAKVLDLFPRLAERRRQARRHHVRRRAADGGDRPRADVGAAAADARRAEPRPRAGARRRALRALAAIGRGGISLLVVEQNVRASLAIAERGYLLEAGRIVGEGPAARARRRPGGAARLPRGGARSLRLKETNMDTVGLMIANEETEASNGATFERRNPVSGAVATKAAAATVDDAIAAVDAAAAAFPDWSALLAARAPGHPLEGRRHPRRQGAGLRRRHGRGDRRHRRLGALQRACSPPTCCARRRR